jgi:hypothetical protein
MFWFAFGFIREIEATESEQDASYEIFVGQMECTENQRSNAQRNILYQNGFFLIESIRKND